jgi:ABC-type lipoprotein release transport system permease subunit
MTSLAKLAWRNLWRHKRRTQLLLAVVAYASIAIIFFWGFFDGVVDMMVTSQARYLEAPVLIASEAYVRDPDPDRALADLAFLDDVRALPDVRAAAPRLDLPALLRSPYRSIGTTVRGVDPAQEPAVSELPGHVAEGRLPTAPGEIVLGRRLAERLDVRVGERLVLDVQSGAGAQAAGLAVVGLFDADIRSVDERVAWIHLDDARALTGAATATGVALDVPAGRERAVAAALNEGDALPAGVAAYGIHDQLSGLLAGIETKRVAMMPIVGLFALFAAVTVMSTVVVSVIERTREFGVTASLGMTQGRIARMVMLEAAFVTGLGFVAGSATGYLLNWILSATNAMGPMMKSVYSGILDNFAISEEIVVGLSLGYLGWTALTVLLAAALALAVPGRRIRALQPAEAMRAA